MVLDMLVRGVIALIILYLLFWVGWFLIHKDALYYLTRSKDKKWQKTKDGSSHFAAKGEKWAPFFLYVFASGAEPVWTLRSPFIHPPCAPASTPTLICTHGYALLRWKAEEATTGSVREAWRIYMERCVQSQHASTQTHSSALSFRISRNQTYSRGEKWAKGDIIVYLLIIKEEMGVIHTELLHHPLERHKSLPICIPSWLRQTPRSLWQFFCPFLSTHPNFPARTLGILYFMMLLYPRWA